jgi:hypothetical protein
MTASRALVRSPMGADTRKFANLELRGLKRDGSFSGYASVFGEVDLGKDAIERGAFRKSLAERGACGVRMLFQHDPAEPIGAWKTIREDSRGLFVEGMLAEGVARAREVHQRRLRSSASLLSRPRTCPISRPTRCRSPSGTSAPAISSSTAPACVLRDPYSARPYVLFYTTKRVGGGVQNFEAIKLIKFAVS